MTINELARAIHGLRSRIAWQNRMHPPISFDALAETPREYALREAIEINAQGPEEEERFLASLRRLAGIEL